MPKNVRTALAGVWVQAVLTLVSGVVGLLNRGGISTAGALLALVVLQGACSAEARNWFDQ